jgi:SAM-dependent methyltransferase
MWAALTDRFKADPHRTGDPTIERLLPHMTAETSLLDVGGGAGRLALPLALRARRVTVVDSSPSMLDALQESARAAGITNLTAVPSTWEDAQVDPADVVLCAHVLYGIADIEPFLRKLAAHAAERVVLVMHMVSPMARFVPFWPRVHGEERIDLPALPELLPVLWELDIYPDLEMLPPGPPEIVPNREAALALLRQFLYVPPGSGKEAALEAAMADLLVETPAGLTVQGLRPRREALVTWRPSSPR